jgi:hypothetical protein
MPADNGKIENVQRLKLKKNSGESSVFYGTELLLNHHESGSERKLKLSKTKNLRSNGKTGDSAIVSERSSSRTFS